LSNTSGIVGFKGFRQRKHFIMSTWQYH